MEEFAFHWNEFNSSLINGFHEFLIRGDLVDVTLAVEGQLIKAHRLVLSVCSTYFRRMFSTMPENQHAFVFLKGVSHSLMKDLIAFLYCGVVNIKQDDMDNFLSFCKDLEIRGLTSTVKQSLSSEATQELLNFVDNPNIENTIESNTSYQDIDLKIEETSKDEMDIDSMEIKIEPTEDNETITASTSTVQEEEPNTSTIKKKPSRRNKTGQRHIRHSANIRKNIVRCALSGGDWITKANEFGVKYNTAYRWVRTGEERPKVTKYPTKPRFMGDGQIQLLISVLEKNPGATLRQLAEFAKESSELKSVSKTSIRRYLDGYCYLVQRPNYNPDLINSPQVKAVRAEYVTQLLDHIQNGKQIIWIDRTNFNIYCQRSKRVVMIGIKGGERLSKGPSIHVLGAITTDEVISIETRVGTFVSEPAKEWLFNVIKLIHERGHDLKNVVLVCGSESYLPGFEDVIKTHFGNEPSLLRMDDLSPMLNPLEKIWAKMKEYIKENNTCPKTPDQVDPEPRIQIILELIKNVINSIESNFCSEAINCVKNNYSGALTQENLSIN